MISIINYGVGNIGSVVNMLRHIGVEPVVVSTPGEIRSAKKLLLPGVGAFDVAMRTLDAKGFINPLRDAALKAEIPILGICLGMQLLGNRSEEGGIEGLGLIDADFVKFSFDSRSAHKVPHMGWNTLKVVRANPLLHQDQSEQRFYFVHSYYACCHNRGDIIATCDHGGEFVAVYGHGNVFGVQFHPEKSHKFGMQLLKNFAEL